MGIYSEDNTQETHRRGRIEVICGSMFSGKTEELIRRLRRAQFAKQRIRIFKPAIDVRYAHDAVVSHDSNSLSSHPVKNSAELLEAGHDVEVVGIDEAQFFDDRLPQVCSELASRGIRVVVAGLDMDFKGARLVRHCRRSDQSPRHLRPVRRLGLRISPHRSGREPRAPRREK